MKSCLLEPAENLSYHGQQRARREERRRGRTSWLQRSKNQPVDDRWLVVSQCVSSAVWALKGEGSTKEKQAGTYLYLLRFLLVPSVEEPQVFIAPDDEPVTTNHDLITCDPKRWPGRDNNTRVGWTLILDSHHKKDTKSTPFECVFNQSWRFGCCFSVVFRIFFKSSTLTCLLAALYLYSTPEMQQRLKRVHRSV